MNNPERPKVGIGVIVRKDGKVLMGKRKGKLATGTWGFTGGHLEFGENPEECAAREAFEETGLRIKNIRRTSYTSDIFDGNHYITLFLVAECEEEPVLKEPDKFEEWRWFGPDEWPDPLFPAIISILKTGFNPFTA